MPLLLIGDGSDDFQESTISQIEWMEGGRALVGHHCVYAADPMYSVALLRIADNGGDRVSLEYDLFNNQDAYQVCQEEGEGLDPRDQRYMFAYVPSGCVSDVLYFLY